MNRENDKRNLRQKSIHEKRQRILDELRRPVIQEGQLEGDPSSTQAWVGAPDDVYATGYKRGADHLVDLLARRGAETDFLVYPILNSYRHCIELMLKQICYSIWAYTQHAPTQQQIKKMNRHNLHKLWNETEDALLLFGYGRQRIDDLADVRDRIMEFHGHDPEGVAFRYSMETNRMEPTLPDLHNINLSQLKRGFEAIWRVLDGTDTMVHEANVARAEAMEYEADARAEAEAENAYYNAEMQAEMNAENREY